MFLRLLSLVVLVLHCAAASAAAQGTSEVRGRDLDPQGALLPGVAVTIRNVETGMFRQTVTGPDGSYLIPTFHPAATISRPRLRGSAGFSGVRMVDGK
jgi:hypothetical protein